MQKFEDFIPKKYSPTDEKLVASLMRYYYGRLERSRYQKRDDTKDAVMRIIRYFAEITAHRTRLRSEAKQAPPQKGLLIYGPCGTGKSMLLKRLCSWENVPQSDGGSWRAEGIEYISTLVIGQNYMIDGERWVRNFFDPLKKDFLVIDEIGSERSIKRFGSDSIVPDIIEDRYEAFVDYGSTTVFVTNAKDRKEIGGLYGDRVLSRFFEMCEFVLCNGKDWRINAN